ncbi:amino-acid n-acetyltransferase subunit mak10 [Neofusicoccum parvum]|nr:amino-acid n-acetyltransferase subunit mak10 [Neofusicoccum parvum]
MIPGVDHQTPADADDGLAQEAAHLRLEEEYAALPSHALGTGQLVKDEYFTLFESVGALEIMDPKMDSGFLAPGETLEEDFDALKELLPEEVIGIMDQLLCYEMSWHQGYPLSQTLFVSVHVDRLLWPEPRTLDEAFFHRPIGPQAAAKYGSDEQSQTYSYPGGKSPLLMILRAYCLGLVKYCDNVIQRVTSRDYFEEEDFSTHTYSRQLLTRFSEEEIVDTNKKTTGQRYGNIFKKSRNQTP